MLIMLSVPILEGAVFWLLLRRPIVPPHVHVSTEAKFPVQSTDTLSTIDSVEYKPKDVEENNKLSEDEAPLIGLKAKIMYIPTLLKYMVPLTLVYLLEYFINQGLVSLID